MSKESQLEAAEHQLRGWISAKTDRGITDLIEGMGLEKSEWGTLKDQPFMSGMPSGDIDEIEEFFEKE